MSHLIYLSQMTLVYFGVISQGKMRTDISYHQEIRAPHVQRPRRGDPAEHPGPGRTDRAETTSYAYDSSGNLTQTTSPPATNSGRSQVTVDTYNPDGELAPEATGYRTSAASTVSYCYDPDGHTTSAVYPDGDTTGVAVPGRRHRRDRLRGQVLAGQVRSPAVLPVHQHPRPDRRLAARHTQDHSHGSPPSISRSATTLPT